ncbi:MAG TPA: nucleotidyl transferase AbiEii/AbiGii toxin family protein [Candidatus Dormibacteraeota bacterium]
MSTHGKPPHGEEVDDGIFFGVLDDAIGALEEAKIPAALMGGIASAALGRHRWTHDIDFFVRPEDARPALNALERHGFATEETDQAWLYKGFKEDILVDIIFSAKGGIRFDEEVESHVRSTEFRGRRLKVVAPEDLVVMKAIAHEEHTPRHWHDALALLAGEDFDWNYVVQRSRYGRRRVLALLIYAQANGVEIPDDPIRSLFTAVYEPGSERPRPRHDLVARVREAVASDPRASELDIHVTVAGRKIFLTGTVITPERRDAVGQVAKEALPDHEVENLIQVIDFEQAGARPGPRSG